MKTINRIKYIIALFLSVLFWSGCEDVLNTTDPGSPTSDTFFETQDQLEVALSGVYESVSYVWAVPFPQILDHATDMAFNRGNVAGTVDATTGALTSTSSLPNNFWRQFYTGIQRANNLLTNMEKAKEVSNPDRYAEIEAEALFLRAFFYSYLIELFGDVPYRTEVKNSLEGLELAKTSKSEIATNIIADLEKAASVLPTSQEGTERGRASANAANTLIARVALFNGDYDKAASAAGKVMETGISLYEDYESLFTASATGAEEIIFDISFLTGTKTHGLSIRQGTRYGGWCQYVPSQQHVDNYETTNGLPIDEDPMFDPANPFENRDPRLKASIVTPGALWTRHIIQQHSDSIGTWRYEGGVPVERVINFNSANPGGKTIVDPYDGTEYVTSGSNRFTSFSGYFWKKFSDEPALARELSYPSVRGEHPIWLMRYAEVLLMYAEAKIEGNSIDQSVLDAINEVRARAYGTSKESTGEYPAITTTDQGELRRVIRRERYVELADEGFRLFDIRRWRIAEKVMNTTVLGGPANGFSKIGGDLGFIPQIDEDGFVSYAGAPSQPRVEQGNLDYRELEVRVFNPARDYLWPIPQAEIDATGGVVTQNPGGY